MVGPDKLKPASLQVYFGSLDARVTPAMLCELGVQAGPIVKSSIKQQEPPVSSFGFVQFEEVEGAITCVALYRGLLKLFGQAVSVNFANQPVPAAHISARASQLLTKCRRLLDVASGAGMPPPEAGAGVARHSTRHDLHRARYQPYGAAGSYRDHRQERWFDRKYAGADTAAAPAAVAGDAALPQQQQPAPPAPIAASANWMEQAVQAAQQAAAALSGVSVAPAAAPAGIQQLQWQPHTQHAQLVHSSVNGSLAMSQPQQQHQHVVHSQAAYTQQHIQVQQPVYLTQPAAAPGYQHQAAAAGAVQQPYQQPAAAAAAYTQYQQQHQAPYYYQFTSNAPVASQAPGLQQTQAFQQQGGWGYPPPASYYYPSGQQ